MTTELLDRLDEEGEEIREDDAEPFDMAAVKKDWLRVVSKVPEEVAYLRLAVLEGRIDGNLYSGECSCLKGTIAQHIIGVQPKGTWRPVGDFWLGLGIKLDPHSLIEKFFYHIVEGDTPATNPYSAVILEWADEFLLERVEKPAEAVALVGSW